MPLFRPAPTDPFNSQGIFPCQLSLHEGNVSGFCIQDVTGNPSKALMPADYTLLRCWRDVVKHIINI